MFVGQTERRHKQGAGWENRGAQKLAFGGPVVVIKQSNQSVSSLMLHAKPTQGNIVLPPLKVLQSDITGWGPIGHLSKLIAPVPEHKVLTKI